MAKHGRLVCEQCGAGLVPTLNGPRCPRLGSCGRGGVEETAESLRPAALRRARDASSA